MKVYFSNAQKAVKITAEIKKLLRNAIGTALEYEKFPSDAEVSVSFVTNDKIHELNREYRGVDRPTDVLSFPMLEGDADEGDIDIDSDSVVLGDIIISAEKAVEQAAAYGHSVERELAFLAVHSTLHLLGYDHERSEEEEKDMFEKQEKILIAAGIPRA
ncbi:MAG: rRNA maturation RNase YbeY [Clostridia bacterium]|nr:rRNA maturation RNase YbeY [Clostridia bacterium]